MTTLPGSGWPRRPSSLGGKGTVALLTSLGSYNLQASARGVTSYSDSTRASASSRTYDVRKKSSAPRRSSPTATNRYPDLSGWISVVAGPIMTRSALAPWIRRRRWCSASTTYRPRPNFLKAGKLHTLVGQNISAGARSGAPAVRDQGGRAPAQTIIDSGVDVVTMENVDAFLRAGTARKRIVAGRCRSFASNAS